MSRSRDPGTFQTTIENSASSVARARRSFSEWLERLGVAGEFCDEMAVVFSELAANASDATASASEYPAVRAWTEDGSVLLEVTNAVSDGEASWDLDVRDAVRPSGRGLMIVRAYTDDLHFEAVDGHIRIRCRRRIE